MTLAAPGLDTKLIHRAAGVVHFFRVLKAKQDRRIACYMLTFSIDVLVLISARCRSLKGIQMITSKTFASTVIATLAFATLAGCSGMSTRDKDTAIGAAVGGVAGSVLTGGGAAGTIGGAAVGGVIGNQVGK